MKIHSRLKFTTKNFKKTELKIITNKYKYAKFNPVTWAVDLPASATESPKYFNTKINTEKEIIKKQKPNLIDILGMKSTKIGNRIKYELWKSEATNR